MSARSSVEIREDLGGDTPPIDAAHALLTGLVAGGAALGWTDPPSKPEIAALLAKVTAGGPHR